MPQHLSVRKEITRSLFTNKFIERLSRTNIFPPIIMHLAISTTLFWYGIVWVGIPVLQGIIAATCGFIFWSFAEYMVHRFLYHTESNSRALFNVQQNAHSIHHQHPIDPTRLAMPPLPGLVLSGCFFLLFWLVSSTYVFVFFPGFMVGYSAYISMHYAQHRIKSPIYGPWKSLWKHHKVHHYIDPYSAYGVTTRFWDFVFHTMPEKK